MPVLIKIGFKITNKHVCVDIFLLCMLYRFITIASVKILINK